MAGGDADPRGARCGRVRAHDVEAQAATEHYPVNSSEFARSLIDDARTLIAGYHPGDLEMLRAHGSVLSRLWCLDDYVLKSRGDIPWKPFLATDKAVERVRLLDRLALEHTDLADCYLGSGTYGVWIHVKASTRSSIPSVGRSSMAGVSTVATLTRSHQ
jgi:hypothetical protein